MSITTVLLGLSVAPCLIVACVPTLRRPAPRSPPAAPARTRIGFREANEREQDARRCRNTSPRPDDCRTTIAAAAAFLAVPPARRRPACRDRVGVDIVGVTLYGQRVLDTSWPRLCRRQLTLFSGAFLPPCVPRPRVADGGTLRVAARRGAGARVRDEDDPHRRASSRPRASCGSS